MSNLDIAKEIINLRDANKIQGYDVYQSPPAHNQVLTWVAPNNRYEPSNQSGSGGSSSAIYSNGEPGTLAVGHLVYFSGTLQVSRASNNTSASPAVGVVLSVTSSEATISTHTKLNVYSGLIVMQRVYMGVNGGIVQYTTPSLAPPGITLQCVGFAVSIDTIQFGIEPFSNILLT